MSSIRIIKLALDSTISIEISMVISILKYLFFLPESFESIDYQIPIDPLIAIVNCNLTVRSKLEVSR